MNKFFLQKLFNIFIFLFLFTTFNFALRSDEHIPVWNPDVIEDVHPIQHAHKLICGIPPELQNLPYAIYPTTPGYNTARLNFNKRFVYFPKAIIAPTTPQEAQFVISILKKYDLPFAVRSGGHCFEPGSLSSDFIIDVKNFNQIIPNIATQEVNIGAGARLGDVIDTLGQINYAIPTGTCPTVGVTGLTLGGGIGPIDRKYGLTADSVKSITLVNADAQLVEVSESNFPDLFWALLGAGNGSYGLVIGFTFKMHYIPVASFYRLSWNWDPKLVEPIFCTWQAWAARLPNNITSTLNFSHPIPSCSTPDAPRVTINISGVKVGSKSFTEWKKAFKHLKPTVSIVKGSYIELAKSFEDTAPFPPFNKVKSRILFQPVTKNVVNQVKKLFEELNETNPNFLVSFNFDRLGGKIKDTKTSFFPSQAFGWWQQTYYWNLQSQTDEILALSRKFYAEIPSEVSKYCYANFVDYDLGKRYLKLYYGDHVNKLIKIKRKYDPTNLFHWKQSIPLKKP